MSGFTESRHSAAILQRNSGLHKYSEEEPHSNLNNNQKGGVMLSFKQKLEESQASPYSLGNILKITNENENFRGLVVSNRGSQAVLLVLTGENTGDLVNTESLQDYEISIVRKWRAGCLRIAISFRSQQQSRTSSRLNITRMN